MHRCDAGDDAGFRLGYFRESSDFSGMRHAHLDDGNLLLGLELEQHERQSKMVVEVAFGLEDTVPLGEYVGDGFFGSGLACGARDANDRLAPETPDGSGQSLQGNQGVVDWDQFAFDGITGSLIFANDGRHCALLKCLVDEVVAIQPLAFNREEELTRLNSS